jgi:hypothetical protein
MKKSFAVMLSFLLLVSIFLQGCGVANQPYLKKDASDATPLKMIRYETPNLRVYSTGGMVGVIVPSAVLFGIIGGGLGYAVHYISTIGPDNPERLDFGKLVMDQFVERSKKEIPNWPAMIVQEKAVEKTGENAIAKDTNLPVDTSYYLIELVVDDIRIEKGSGLATKTTITMKDTEGKTVWEKGYVYDCTIFKRVNNFNNLKAHKYEKLNDEFIFAAEQTVNDFITHFNDSLPIKPYADDKRILKGQYQPAKKIKATTGTDPIYNNIKGIVLKDGTVIEGQIVDIRNDVLLIRTKDDRLTAYDFMTDVKNYLYEK